MNLDETIDYLTEKYDMKPLEMRCDGGCGRRLTRNDERYSRFVEPMWMLLCPECAADAGWIDE